MSDSTSNFYINEAFNINYDVTWSFMYSITGSNTSSGGFSTFLFGSSALEGGGTYAGLGFAPYQATQGVKDAIIGVMFDSNNTITIKTATTFTTITSFSLGTLLSPLIKTTDVFNTIRFNFTDAAQTLKISVKNKENNKYIDLVSVSTGISAKDTDFCKVGFSYASPMSPGNSKITFKIKDIHIQGNKAIPTTTYKKRPDLVTDYETFYILQSPLSGKINIGIPDPISTGSILYK